MSFETLMFTAPALSEGSLLLESTREYIPFVVICKRVTCESFSTQ